ncbi:MAG: acyl-CoA dehydrogenase family protein [Anaerolineae bacterium]
MDFSFSKEHQLLRKAFREFTEQEIAPRVDEIEHSKSGPPSDLMQKAAGYGIFGVPFPQEYGGMGAGETGYCILMEELNRVSPSFATVVGAHIGIGAMSIYLDGNEAQKQKYLVPLARGEQIAAFALTEPGAGSDAAATRTRAVREGDSYILDGTKHFITNGSICDVSVVLALTDPTLGPRGGMTAFIVESQWEGFKVSKLEDKMGIRGSPTCELVLDGVRVPQENVLGSVGLGFVTFMKTLDVGRTSLGAASLGGAQRMLDLAVEWAVQREAFGGPIAHKQSIQWMIADMATEIEALRSLIYRTAWMIDTGQPYTRQAAICKLYGSEVCSRVTDKALQIFGALGYSRHMPLERAFRDARISEIFEGTNEIQRIVIASDIFQKHGLRIRP